MSNVIGGPAQVLSVGIAIIVAVTGPAPTFCPEKDKISPLPFAVRPIEISEFVQFTVAPVGLLKKLTGTVLLPTQIV